MLLNNINVQAMLSMMQIYQTGVEKLEKWGLKQDINTINWLVKSQEKDIKKKRKQIKQQTKF